MKSYGPVSSTFTDAPCPKPATNSTDGTSFGEPLAQGPSPAKGEIQGVQYSDAGPKSGAKNVGMKIPGGGSY